MCGRTKSGWIERVIYCGMGVAMCHLIRNFCSAFHRIQRGSGDSSVCGVRSKQDVSNLREFVQESSEYQLPHLII